MYKHILVAVDGSPTSNLALQEAARMAPGDACIRVVTVVENPVWTLPLEAGVIYDVDLMHHSLLKAGQGILARAKAQLEGKGMEVRTHLIDLCEIAGFNIPKAILQEAEDWPADVIVIGTHGRRGVSRLLMGSVADAVLRAATRPVLLVRAPGSADNLRVEPGPAGGDQNGSVP
jgi:nucleotide-binding universal stress UspA family protein